MTAHAHDEFQLAPPSTGFGKSLTEELEPLGNRMRNHPIVEDVEAGTASRELIRGFTKEFLPIVRGTYRRMAMRLQNAAFHDYHLQMKLLKECEEEVFHTPMYLKWCTAIGMKVPEDLIDEMFIPETYAFVLLLDSSSAGRATLEETCGRVFEADVAWDGFNNYSQQSSLVQTIAISGLALRGFPVASDRLRDGFKEHYGYTDEQVEFWTEHGTVDMEHAEMGVDIIDRYATTQGLQKRAREAAILSLELWLRQWDAIYAKYKT